MGIQHGDPVAYVLKWVYALILIGVFLWVFWTTPGPVSIAP